jgi:2-phospho-L-lactate guanylyltransferase (CobY/MobA/RfbA family)
MLRGVLAQIDRLPANIDRVMITNYAPAIVLAQTHGFALIEEGEQSSESASVDAASAALEAQGYDGVLRVPLDLPVLDVADLETILARAQAGVQAVLVPSFQGTGTNGLYRAPPTLFASRFGPGSLALHEAGARARTSAYEVLPLTSMALDIDDPEDIRLLLDRRVACPAVDYLHSIGISGRLAAWEAARQAGGK